MLSCDLFFIALLMLSSDASYLTPNLLWNLLLIIRDWCSATCNEGLNFVTQIEKLSTSASNDLEGKLHRNHSTLWHTSVDIKILTAVIDILIIDVVYVTLFTSYTYCESGHRKNSLSTKNHCGRITRERKEGGSDENKCLVVDIWPRRLWAQAAEKERKKKREGRRMR